MNYKTFRFYERTSRLDDEFELLFNRIAVLHEAIEEENIDRREALLELERIQAKGESCGRAFGEIAAMGAKVGNLVPDASHLVAGMSSVIEEMQRDVRELEQVVSGMREVLRKTG